MENLSGNWQVFFVATDLQIILVQFVNLRISGKITFRQM